MKDASEPQGVYLDGGWQAGAAAPLEDVSPIDGAVIARIAQASPGQAEAALAAAERAQEGWVRLGNVARAEFLVRMADRLESEAERVAGVITREMGKPNAQALGEVGFASAILRYTAEWARRIEGELVPSDDPAETIRLLREPIGVVVAILPWNYPLALFVRKAAPALLTGNTVVVKPSELTPLVALEMTRIAEACDLPPGVLNLTVGDSAVGEALVASPRTGLVTLTGSTGAGKAVMAACSANLTRVALELGGKAPAIVWRDADIDLAVAAIVEARHLNSGQVCTCAERVFVHEEVCDEFTRAYADAVAGLTIGDPEGQYDLGPMVSEAQLEKVVAATDEAIEGGATAVVRGSRPDGAGFESGSWLSPSVLTDVAADSRLMTAETFGPVTPIAPVGSIEEALSAANRLRAGLAAYLFSFDSRVVHRFTQGLRCGEVYVNRSIGEAIQGFHSGHRESGLGGEDGRHGILKYTQIKTVYERFGE